MPDVTVAPGVDLYYELHGEGAHKVLMIMGLGTSSRGWKDNIDQLIEHKHYQFCVFDNRGIGFSSKPPGRYTTQLFAQDTEALLNHLGWDKVHIVGISMGGMIAQELALRIPEKVLSLALCVTHFGAFGTILPPVRGLSGMLKSFTKTDPMERIPIVVDFLFSKKYLDELAPDGRTNREFQIDRLLENARELPPVDPKAYMSQVMAVNTHKVAKDRLKKLCNYPIEILVITASDDQLVAPKHSYALNKLLSPAEFVVFEGVGHGVNVEKKEEFNAALVRNFERAIEKFKLHPEMQQEALEIKEKQEKEEAEEEKKGKEEVEEEEEEKNILSLSTEEKEAIVKDQIVEDVVAELLANEEVEEQKLVDQQQQESEESSSSSSS